MILYVSGGMSGYQDHNFPAFFAAENQLLAAGYEVKNPASNQPEGLSWEQYMRMDLQDLLECDGVAVLDGWEASRGARLETYVARQLGMRVRPVACWLALGAIGAERAENVA